MKVFVKAVEECMKMKMRQHRGRGMDVTGQGVGGGTTTGVKVSPENLGGIRSLYVKSAHLDTAAYLRTNPQLFITIVLLIFTSHILTHSLTPDCVMCYTKNY